MVPPPPPMQPPPQQFDKSIQSSNDSVTEFFKNAVTKVQNGMWVFMDFLFFLLLFKKMKFGFVRNERNPGRKCKKGRQG